MGRMKVASAPPVAPAPSLMASASVLSDLTAQEVSRINKSLSWQQLAYKYYHEIGEYRFSCDWKGNMLSKATLYATFDDGTGPKKVDPKDPAAFWMAALCGDADGQKEMLRLFGIHWTIAGECFLIAYKDTDPLGDGGDKWVIAAPTKFHRPGGDLKSSNEKYKVANMEIPVPASEVYVLRIWSPDVEDPEQAMSPSQAVLSDLAEISRLTDHVAAQIDSRLAGAGILLMPSEITMPTPPVPDGAQVKQANSAVDLMRLINQAMAQSIRNRANASAMVPIVITAPGEYIKEVQHLTFWTDLDEKAIEMRREAIRRLALGMDMPPEVLMGTAESNHWNAWQADEASIKAHTEPLLKIITTSLARGYLRRNLMGGADEYEIAAVAQTELRKYTIAADTSEMRLRPNRSKEAMELYAQGVLNMSALIRETGFDEDDMMGEEERKAYLLFKVASGQTTPEYVHAALKELGVDLKITAAPEGEQGHEARPTPSLENHPVIEIPDQDRSERRRDARDNGDVPSAGPERRAALSEDRVRLAAAVAVGSEQAVFRALERAGNRMRAKMGGKIDGISAKDTYLSFGAKTGDLDYYLEDAWGENVYSLAQHSGISPEQLKGALDGYCRALIASQKPHTFKGLEAHLEMSLRGVAA